MTMTWTSRSTILTMSTTRGTDIAQYSNGNTMVTISRDGTKTREWNGDPVPERPESIDLKITDYCDLGCDFCHESSTTEGKHAEFTSIQQALGDLPAGVEIAIGGGNPLDHPDLIQILEWMRERGLIANITINQGHLKKHELLVRRIIQDELAFGIGISITSRNLKLLDVPMSLTDNVVFHVIAGIHTPSLLDDLASRFSEPKVLVLGYKLFGRGVNAWSKATQEAIGVWRRMLPNYMGKIHLSFDNLAIEQLNVRRCFTKEGWDRFYMGDDFTFTMYIDAVKRQYAPTSRNPKRADFDSMTATDYFQRFANADDR